MIKTKSALIISPNFYPAIGGAEKQAFLISQQLIKQGYEVLVITRKYLKETENVEVFKRIKIQRFTGTLWRILPYLFCKQDLIIWNGLFDRKRKLTILIQTILILVSKIRNPKVIFRVPCVTEPFLKPKFVMTLLKVAVSKWFPINSSQIDELLRSEIAPEKIIPLPNLIATTTTLKTKKISDPDIVFCGRTVSAKGIPLLIGALNKIVNQKACVLFLLSLPIKYPEESAKNLQFFNDLKISFVLKFEDKRPTENFKKGQIGVFPSLSEGGGNVLREMMATGMAVVASDLPACKDVITDGQNGLLFKTGSSFDLASKLNKLINDPSMVVTLGKNARLTIKKIGNAKSIVSKILA